jgi:hypothetical protein
MQKELEGSLDTTLERFVYDCITNMDKISAPSRNVKQNNSIASSELRQVDVGRILLTNVQESSGRPRRFILSFLYITMISTKYSLKVFGVCQ